MKFSDSPCIGICKIEEGTCIGCSRTKDEISMWSKLVTEDRMKVLEEIQFRTATHRCPSCGDPTYCAMEAGKSANTCWCMTMAKDYNPNYYGDSCLCTDCLSNT